MRLTWTLLALVAFVAADEEGWKGIPTDGAFDYPWEDVPLEVKTTFSLQDAESRVWFACDGVGRLNTQGSSYRIGDCDPKPMTNLPAASDNIRTWKFIKNGFEGFSIECNGVLVAEHRFSEDDSSCSPTQDWMNTKCTGIFFNADWNSATEMREICKNPLPEEWKVSTSNPPPVLFGTEIRLTCPGATDSMMGSNVVTCDNDGINGEFYSYDGNEPRCSTTPCLAGNYMTDSGCQQCGENTYSGPGASSCTSCPDSKVSAAGSGSVNDCQYEPADEDEDSSDRERHDYSDAFLAKISVLLFPVLLVLWAL